MKKSKRLLALACGLWLASTGLALAGPRVVKLQRTQEVEPRVHVEPAARLAMPYQVKSGLALAGSRVVKPQRTQEIEPRVHLEPAGRWAMPYQVKSGVELERATSNNTEPRQRALATADGAVQLQQWIFDLRSFFSLLP